MNEIPFRPSEIAQTTPLIELKDVWKTFITGGDVRVPANSSPSWARPVRASRR